MLVESTLCCGCGSCAAICPSKCITMAYDGEGFRYPHVDYSKCVHCQACKTVCPVMRQMPPRPTSKAIAAQNRDDGVRQFSSSGGVFFALAKDVIQQGGCVCAAIYDNDFTVTHMLADTLEAVVRQRGAKYPQSRAEQCYAEIRTRLRTGKPVLFVGTPCQTAGLYAFLGRDYQNLLLVDMICHGVISSKVWTRYLKERQQLDADGSAPVSINLRSKVSGWSHYHYSISIGYSNGKSYSVPQGEDPLMQGFVQNLYLRPSCSQCVFKENNRFADLTLADYWGIWEQYPDFDDNQGTSLLLVHTPKGETAWKQVSDQFRFLEARYDEALSKNPSAVKSSVPHPARITFFKELDSKKSVIRWIQHCLAGQNPSLFQRIRSRLGV